MSDEPKPDRKRSGCAPYLVVFLGATCVFLAALFMGVRYLAHHMADLEALTATSFAIERFISERQQWPQSWESLAPYFADLEPPRDDDDVSEARKRIEVNFQIDFRKTSRPSDWYVHVKSQTNEAQEDEQNYMLRQRITELQKKPAQQAK